MMKVVKDPQIEVEIPSHFHKVPSKQHQSQGKQQPLVGQALGLRQARLEHLQSHHNSSLLFGAKQPNGLATLTPARPDRNGNGPVPAYFFSVLQSGFLAHACLFAPEF